MSYLFRVLGFTPPDAWPFPRTQPELARLKREILQLVEPALFEAADRLAWHRPEATASEIERFLEVYARRPLASNRHGSGFNDSLWLWLVARWLGPEMILESGTFMGHSAWLFRMACPDARIETHDVELPPAGRLRAAGVAYHLADLGGAKTRADDPAKSLCFFDDHISHALRLRQARERGFQLALFDDNFPSWQLHATGAPPIPSLSMLLSEESLTNGIEWQRNGKHYGYDAAEDLAREREEARTLVAASYSFPDLAQVTRLPPGSNLTLVRLARGDDTD